MPRKDVSDLQALRRRLTPQRGREYWRSLEELADSAEFQQYVEREFPEGASQWNANRREFLALMGASLALAGLSGCEGQPPEQIVPYVKQPEQLVPGKPLYFATVMSIAGIATGLLVESHMGRPTKIEGNPNHPSVPGTFWQGSETTAPGVSDIFSQAAILTLYDPDRSETVMNAGEISTWDAFLTTLRAKLEGQGPLQGRGIRLLTETVTSPTLAAQITEFRQLYPESQWHQFEPVNRDNALAGAKLALGEYVSTHYHLDRADVILSLDADFLTSGPDHLRHALDFANRRDVKSGRGSRAEMNRLYVVESTPTLTGAKADHRLPLRAAQIEAFCIALAHRLGVGRSSVDETAKASDAAERSSEFPASSATNAWLKAVADDLQSYRREDDPGASLVVVGPSASPLVHALAHAMNDQLGNVGKTVTYSAPVEAKPVMQHESLRSLVADIQAGNVDVLCILGGNPVYAAPADLRFSGALDKVPFRIHLGLYEDETSARCHWHIPEAHFLESWGDARAADGTASIIQPLIAPFYQGKTSHELLSALLGKPGRTSYDLIKEHWRKELNDPEDFDSAWQTALHEGVIPETNLPRKNVTLLDVSVVLEKADRSQDSHDLPHDQVDVVFRPDPTIWDGRFANNGWLQELPKPFSKLTWDNAAFISLELATQLQLQNGDVVELDHEGRILEAPVWIVPGHPIQSLTVHLGYGRTHAGRIGTGTGFNAYKLQISTSPWRISGVSLRTTGRRVPLAATQHHRLMEGRDLVRAGTLEQLQDNPLHPQFMQSHEHGEATSLFPPDEHKYEGYKWAMTIDLNRCIGCNACAVACQAENNIPVVGKDQVAGGREMHWIRVDSYYEGPAANPRVVHQPVPCMHCENAPCELVCPVGATVHGDEGLNEMVYNRCVGTRYCSNNCPYKVRRFNFLQYSDLETPSLKLLNNPNVTVRNRGVMEKCTYCVQRISAARIQSEKEVRSIRDGELVTACQAACPSQAIVFGDLNDPASRVKQQTDDPLNYALLGELNTRPRTTYLAALRNPNPGLSADGR
ncbi:MAG: TAT-variant-translocated molybdopterin oxidoreductase [Pirellulaceae bacterium]